MSTGFYNILTFIDNICEAYEEKKENDIKNDDNKEENINNIRTIRNILRMRNINEDYNNNRHIISNILTRNSDNNGISSIISLFVTNYMNSRNSTDNKNDDSDIDLSVCVYTDLDELVKKKNENCSICLEKNDCDDTLILTKCEHLYHYKCIKEWVEINKSCPLCRSVI